MEKNTIELVEYVEQMALLLDLPLDTECKPGVVENFARIKAIASVITEFPLPDEIEIASVFQP